MKSIKWLVGVLLALVIAGSGIIPALAAEQKLTRQQRASVIIDVPTVVAVKDNKSNVSSRMFKNASGLILKAESALGCKLLPLYHKAKVYYTIYKGIKTMIGKIPLKSDKPTLFIFAKNRLKTVAIVEVIDLKKHRVIYYITDGRHQYIETTNISIPIDERVSEDNVVTPFWITDPTSFNGTHELITYYSAIGMGLSYDYAKILADHSGDPDRYDSDFDRYYKHAYDPILGIGGAPDACDKNVSDAINSFNNGDYTNGYIHLAHALHYLEDVGNPYHTWLEPNGLFHNLINHIYYEDLVSEKQWSWDLHTICYCAHKQSITSPKSAVKSLAQYSRSKAEILDSWVTIYRVTRWNYALDNIKGITQDVIGKTAGYVKGLIEYTIP